jgi:hypothetical protein
MGKPESVETPLATGMITRVGTPATEGMPKTAGRPETMETPVAEGMSTADGAAARGEPLAKVGAPRQYQKELQKQQGRQQHKIDWNIKGR